MTRTNVSYRTKKIKNYRRKTLRKSTKDKRNITHIFHLCLKCTLMLLFISSTFFISNILYKKISLLPYFQVKEIQVEGCLRHTPDQILYMAGLKPRVNLLSLDLKHICQSIENSPWVERAKIKRILPDQLDISITERMVAALINLNQLYLVDKKGNVFKKAENEDGLMFPVLTGVTWENLMQHQHIYTALIKQALTLMNCLKKTGIPLATISEIHLDITYGLTVFTTHYAAQIEMGFPPYQGKCKRLCNILRDLKQKNLLPQNIDLNYKNKAFVKSKPQYEAIKPVKKGGDRKWGKMEI